MHSPSNTIMYRKSGNFRVEKFHKKHFRVKYICYDGLRKSFNAIIFKHVAEEKRVCCIRGYHVWEEAAGEVLVYEREPHNALDRYDPAACQCLSRW